MELRTAAIGAAVVMLSGCGSASTSTATPAATHTTTAAPASLPTPRLTCEDVFTRPLVADMRKQDKLSRAMGNGLPASTKDGILGGAWVDPGTYSADLDAFLSVDSDVLSGDRSDPASLSRDVAVTVHFGNVLNDDADLGAISTEDYRAFRRAVHRLAADCPPS